MGDRRCQRVCFGAMLVLTLCGCGTQEARTESNQPESEPAKMNTTGTEKPNDADERHFKQVKIVAYYNPEQDHLSEPETIEISDPATIDALAAHFKDAGKGKESEVAGGWLSFADIDFVKEDGKPISVSVSTGLDTWSEGHGDWPIPDAADFESLLFKVLRKQLPPAD